MLQQALAMSLEGGASSEAASAAPVAAVAAASPDLSAMTEEEQIAYAMQISMQDSGQLLYLIIITDNTMLPILF